MRPPCRRACQDRIDILITDVVMPGIGGRELAKKLLLQRPDISRALSLGIHRRRGHHTRRATAASAFLQKPFTLQNLAKKVREVLRDRALPPSPKLKAKAASN
jgi:two-component system cell cycle sensor histidine kinase/response regulator CckA